MGVIAYYFSFVMSNANFLHFSKHTFLGSQKKTAKKKHIYEISKKVPKEGAINLVRAK